MLAHGSLLSRRLKCRTILIRRGGPRALWNGMLSLSYSSSSSSSSSPSSPSPPSTTSTSSSARSTAEPTAKSTAPAKAPAPPPTPHLARERDDTLYQDQDHTWVDKYCPNVAQPYLKLARVDRPIGTMLLLWPCWWSISLAAPGGSLPDLSLCALFGVGAFVMRGAGCTINDMWDRRFDAQVIRTVKRPLASGRVSMFNALVFLAAQLSCGLAVLTQLNAYSITLGAASLGLVVAYPLAKRFTDFPQAVLGLTFNWGALLGWSAVHGSCEWSVVLPLYASGVAWTLVYDTLYAHQDKVDDRRLGLRSTALYFGESKGALFGFASVSTAALFICGVSADLAWPFYCGAVGAGAHMAWQVHSAEFDNRENLNRRFVSNNQVGAIIMSGIFLESII